jgi:anti-sigma factor RsiW
LTGCKKLLVQLSNYLDGDLDPALRRELELHLKACPDCWVICDTTRKTIEIFRGNEPYPMPEDVKTRLADALRRKLTGRQP